MSRRPRDYVVTVPELGQLMVAERRAQGEDAQFDHVVAERLCDLGFLEAVVARGRVAGTPDSTAYELTFAGREALAGRTG